MFKNNNSRKRKLLDFPESPATRGAHPCRICFTAAREQPCIIISCYTPCTMQSLCTEMQHVARCHANPTGAPGTRDGGAALLASQDKLDPQQPELKNYRLKSKSL